ncbi:MAG: metallophosphoesterase [bacterium]
MEFKYFFTADLHLDHFEMIQHCQRPFSSVEEMNEHLIVQWNKVVMPQDVVIHCGDFGLGLKWQMEPFKKRLNGNAIFIKGNHDHWMKEKRYEYHKKFNFPTILYVYATHFPLRTWVKDNINGYNLHGHCHGSLAPFYNQLDVGIDNVNRIWGKYRPISLDEIHTQIQKQNSKIREGQNNEQGIFD